LPPAYDEELSINIAIETVPDYYWQVVPAQDFVSDDLSGYIVRERYEPILRETRPLGNVVINNDVVVNNVVNVTYVEQKTNEKVVVHQVEKTEDAAKAGKIEGSAVEVFQPASEPVHKADAPPRPKNVEEVKVKSKTKEQGLGKPSTDELLVPPEIKKPAGEAALPAPPPLPPESAEGPQGKDGKQKKAKGRPQPEDLPAMEPGMAPPPPPQEAGPPPPAGKQKKAKGRPHCPEGTVSLDDGTCGPVE
jgi:hypothetical protein